ncbi:hypothetical protein GOEFS_094_00380 [Gordonia effusa NBRC 100432]|uniref:Protein RecA n=1 Tax=Gordonia effusa NBRC 100432 TaxID=1077974 RepID=H0R3T8_9ACTN|nr:hypothetical protein [Gordonia effusa]GAB19739.1 hypothetical protein GOEFS_094_00380 [Gordonia effusa NBRC 100432]
MGDRADVDLSVLRKQMAALSGRAGQRNAGSADERPVELLAVPRALAELLPHNGIARGSVVTVEGARSMVVALIAAVSGAGGQVAVVGMPQLSMLSAVQMGADLSGIAVVDDPGPDPVEIGGILLDGMDLVVLGLGGVAVPPARAKVLAGRARKQSAVLIVTGGRWPGAQLRLSTRVVAYQQTPAVRQEGLRVTGYGRILGWRLQVCVEGRGQRPMISEIDCRPGDGGDGSVRLSVVEQSLAMSLAVAN